MGFPNYLSRFQQMVEELSSQGLLWLPQPQTSAPAGTHRSASSSGCPATVLSGPRKSVLEQIMPSDFLTPFLELDEEFCKVSRPRSGVRSGSWEGFR